MQKNSKKVLSACSVATLLVAGTTLPSTVKADSSSQVTRIGGQNRYETAAKVADSGWSSSNYAIVANGEGYADALCATPLAKAKDAPILLTTGDSLNENALKELNDLKVQHVIVIGGTKVVPENVESEIKSKVSTVQDVQRLGGQDRYETSVKIADALGTNPTKAVVASGEGYADALSAGPAAAINGIPILLTRQNSLPDAESNYLKTNSDITATYVIGGTMSVSDSVASSLPSSERLGGTDRYATNAAVLNKFKSDFNFNNVYAALGDGPVGNEFADALTGGALAAKNKNPLVITGYELSSSTEGFLKDNVPKNSTLTVLGGTLNISDSLADTITDAFGKASTGGGGGGSTETNLASTIQNNDSYKDVVNSINNSDYFKILKSGDAGYDDSVVTVQMKKDNISTPGGISTDAGTRYKNEDGSWKEQQIRDDINKIQSKLDIINEKNILINSVHLDDFLAGLGSRYIDDAGKLDADAIVDEVKTKGAGYAYRDFRSNVIDKIKYYFDNNKSAPSSLELKVLGSKVNNIKKGNITLFDSSLPAEQAATDLVSKVLLPDGNYDLTGTYTVNISGNSYVNVTIKK
ncbi:MULTISPECIES: cell wall-binding repeat-containing protein [Clostridium]|uniref:Cell wall-binding repeat-containing protein n=1 Tax=Clostridium lapidicellarium TaxID=3240931 RepID=A0ABV4DZR6_9CLOT